MKRNPGDMVHIYIPGERWWGECLPNGRVRSLNTSVSGMPWGAVFLPVRWDESGHAVPPTITDPKGVMGRSIDPKRIERVDLTPLDGAHA